MWCVYVWCEGHTGIKFTVFELAVCSERPSKEGKVGGGLGHGVRLLQPITFVQGEEFPLNFVRIMLLELTHACTHAYLP